MEWAMLHSLRTLPVSFIMPLALKLHHSFPLRPVASSPDLGSANVWGSAEQSQNLAQKQDISEFKSHAHCGT